MKKWIIIFVLAGIGFNFGWLAFRDYYCKKHDIPKSHFIGYLIYREKYMTNRRGPAVVSESAKKKKKEEKKTVVKKKPKTIASIAKTYNNSLKSAKNKRDKLDADITYYNDMSAIEKDPLKKKSWKEKYIDKKAVIYAEINSVIQYNKKLTEYEKIKKKISNYRKNGIRPPSKLLKLQKNKPDKNKIYKTLYAKEKKRLSGSNK